MSNVQLRKALGLVTPVERLVVRNALKRTLAKFRMFDEMVSLAYVSIYINLHGDIHMHEGS